MQVEELEVDVGMEFVLNRTDLALLSQGLLLLRKSPVIASIPLHPDDYARLCELRRELVQAFKDLEDETIVIEDDETPPEERN